MAGETTVATTAAAPAMGAMKTFVMAHPIGVAMVGGIGVGILAYYLVKAFSGKKAEKAAA